MPLYYFSLLTMLISVWGAWVHCIFNSWVQVSKRSIQMVRLHSLYCWKFPTSPPLCNLNWVGPEFPDSTPHPEYSLNEEMGIAILSFTWYWELMFWFPLQEKIFYNTVETRDKDIEGDKLNTQNIDFLCSCRGERGSWVDRIPNDDLIRFVIWLYPWQFRNWFPALGINTMTLASWRNLYLLSKTGWVKEYKYLEAKYIHYERWVGSLQHWLW